MVDTDKSFDLNGGKLINLASDMIQKFRAFGRKVVAKSKDVIERCKKAGIFVKTLISGKNKKNVDAEPANFAKSMDDYYSVQAFFQDFYKRLQRMNDGDLTEDERNALIETCKENILSLRNKAESANLDDLRERIPQMEADLRAAIENEEELVEDSVVSDVIDESKGDDVAELYRSNVDDVKEPEVGEPVIGFQEEPDFKFDDVETSQEEPEVDVEEPEIEAEEPEIEVEEPEVEVEEPEIEVEEPEIEVEESGVVNLNDWTQFESYREWRIAYRKARVDIKVVDNFYADLDEGIFPSDFVDKKTWEIGRQRMLDEREYRKLEAERAETEKRLKQIMEQQAILNEEFVELQERFKDRGEKLASLRNDNVVLKQTIADQTGTIEDKNRGISDLQDELGKVQDVVRQAQAEKYDAIEAYNDLKKQLESDKRRVAELEERLAQSEKETVEAREELKQTKARISENAEAALQQIKSLRNENNEDELESAALDWKISRLEQDVEPKAKPKHFSEDVNLEEEQASEGEQSKGRRR